MIPLLRRGGEPPEPQGPLAYLGAKTLIIPRGPWVYALHEPNDSVFYVGQSENLASRIGRHVEGYGQRLHHASLIECTSENHMYVTEQWLIDMLQPSMNTLGTENEERMRAVRRRLKPGGTRWDHPRKETG